MAETLELRRDATTIDLLDGDPGWSVVDPGWVPKVCEYVEGRLPPPIVEVLKISGVGFASQDALATAEIALNKMGVAASRYIGDRTEEHPVWLYDQLNAETGQRRALVRKMRMEKLTQQHGVDCEGLILDAEPVFILTIEREPYWERTAARVFPYAFPAAAASVIYDYTATANVVGDTPARIEASNLGPWDGSNTWELDRVWIGVRSANKHGTLANFKNIWECEDGTNISPLASDAADGTASGGTKVTTTATVGTWVYVMGIRLDQITANYSDNFGLFLWLLRTKVTSGTWEIRLEFTQSDTDVPGMSDVEAIVVGPTILVDTNLWDYKEMGISTVPLRDCRILPLSLLAGSFERRGQIQIWARRKTGTGSLDLDCLCPIPLDEGYCIADGINAASGAGIDKFWVYSESPFGTAQSYTILDSPAAIHDLPQFNKQNFRLPIGDGRMYAVYAPHVGIADDITKRIRFNHDAPRAYYECWHTLRGSE